MPLYDSAPGPAGIVPAEAAAPPPLTPYDWRRMGEYVAVALAVFAASEAVASRADNMFIGYTFNIIALAAYVAYLVRRERIDLRAMMRAVLKRS